MKLVVLILSLAVGCATVPSSLTPALGTAPPAGDPSKDPRAWHVGLAEPQPWPRDNSWDTPENADVTWPEAKERELWEIDGHIWEVGRHADGRIALREVFF